MPKHEIFDTMERGYSDSNVTTSSTAPSAAHSRTMSKQDKDVRSPGLYDHEVPGMKGHDKDAHFSLESFGRAVAVRGMRAMRRGNLPFLIVFVTALFVFFGALAGIGYVDPDAQALAPASEFVMGQPVFDSVEGQRMRAQQMEEQRALELQWAKKKRPNAGAWMKKQRDDGAVRGGARNLYQFDSEEEPEARSNDEELSDFEEKQSHYEEELPDYKEEVPEFKEEVPEYKEEVPEYKEEVPTFDYDDSTHFLESDTVETKLEEANIEVDEERPHDHDLDH